MQNNENPKNRFKCYVAVALLLVQDGKILLMKRANTGFGDGLYGLPGGCIDGNEPMKNAVVREAKEELDITLDPQTLELSSVLHVAPHFRTPNEVLLFGFIANKFSGSLQNKEPDKCDELRFFAPSTLPENILEGSKKLIENMQSQVNFSELHW